MKISKLLLTLLLMTALLTMVGCSKKDETQETATDNSATEATDTTEAAADTTTEGSEEAFTPIEVIYGEGLGENGHLEGVKALDYTELPDYEGVSIPSDVHTVTDETLQTQIDGLLGYFTTTEQVMDRALVDGDTVNIDYVGSIDGVEFEGGNTMGNGAEVTIGVTAYIDDFLEQLIGHTPGESFDIEVTFPENYGKEELNGKDAVFAITINYITETVTPELSDQFVADNLSSEFGWNTVDEMKTAMAEDLKKTSVFTFIQNFIIENTTVSEVPEAAITYQQETMINYYKGSANNYGISLDEFLSGSVGVASVEELIESSKEQTAEAAKYSVIIQAIAEDAGIEVTEEVVSTYFIENADMEDYSEIVEQYGLPYIKSIILQDSVLGHIVDSAVME